MFLKQTGIEHVLVAKEQNITARTMGTYFKHIFFSEVGSSHHKLEVQVFAGWKISSMKLKASSKKHYVTIVLYICPSTSGLLSFEKELIEDLYTSVYSELILSRNLLPTSKP